MPTPAPSRERGTSSGASHRPAGKSRSSPGQTAMAAQSGASAGHAAPLALLRRTKPRAGKTTGSGRGSNPNPLGLASTAIVARVPPNHWDSGFTPESESVPAPAAGAPAAAPAADAEAAAAAPAAGGADDDDAMSVEGDDGGAIAAAPQPSPALRTIAIQSRKRKGPSAPTLEGVLNAAGGGDAATQAGANAPDAQLAPDRARDISRVLNSRPRWVSGSDEFAAVRVLRAPPADGEPPGFPIPSPLGTQEELLAPPTAGPTVQDFPPTDSTAPVGNAYSSPRPGGAEATRWPEPPKAPPLAPLAPNTDLCDARGIRCHLVRAATVPTGDPTTKAGRARLFPTVFDEALIKFEMVAEADASSSRGWGPFIQIEFAHSAGKEVIHGRSAEFVMRDYPAKFPDRVAIHRVGARHDASGTLFVEFPAGAGPQVATFIHTWVHLPGALPAKARPNSEALIAPPVRSASSGGGISVEFFSVDCTYARRGASPRRQGQSAETVDGLVHVVATGDPTARTALLALRRSVDRSTVTTLDLAGAQVTVAPGRRGQMAVQLTLRAVDSAGVASSFQRHLLTVSPDHGPRAGPRASDLATSISSIAICASGSTADAPSTMTIDQGAGASAEEGAPPPPSVAEEEATRASIALIGEPPPEGKRHLAIIGHGYKPQFDAAVRNAPNVGLHVVHLQSAGGFADIVPRLVGLAPTDVVEYVVIIDDMELHHIRLMLAGTPQEVRARAEEVDALVASVTGATTLLLTLPGSPKVSIFIWEELDPSKSDPSEAVSEKLSRFFAKSTDVHVLSQFPADADGNSSAQTIAVRAQWQGNLRSYRPYPTTGQRKDIPRGWTTLALGMMVQSMFGGATSRLALRRQQELDSRRFDVPITATIRGTGPAPSIAEQRDATHHYLFTQLPDRAFEVARHQIHSMDGRAHALVATAIAFQPPAGVLRAYAANKSPATDDLVAILTPPDGPIVLADFGRAPYAAVFAATAAFASAANSMAPKPRFNLQFVLNDVTSVLEIAKDDVPAFRLSFAHAAASVANRAYYFVTTLGNRPDIYCDHLALFANDAEKIAARGAIEVIQRSSGIASRSGQAALSLANASAFQNTKINSAGDTAERLMERWIRVPEALRNTPDAFFAPPVAPPAPPGAESDDGADEDEEDPDLVAGASVVATQLAPRTGEVMENTPWMQSPQGTLDDLMVALAVTGLPAALIWVTPSSDHPITRVMEWRNSVYPLDPMDGSSPTPVQTTMSQTKTFVPKRLDAAGVAVDAATWLTEYVVNHVGWSLIVVRSSPDDGLLSFSALVRPSMAKPPSSISDEAAAAAEAASAAYAAAAGAAFGPAPDAAPTTEGAAEAAGGGASPDAAAAAPAGAAAGDATAHVVDQIFDEALKLQKSSVSEIHHRLDLAYVAHRGALAMCDSDTAASKEVMVDEATRNTLLDESFHSTFDPDSLPSEPAARKTLVGVQDELRAALAVYDASLTARGVEDDTTGKWTRALSLLMTLPARGTTSSRAGGSGDELSTPNEVTTSPATTTTTLTSPPPPLLTARSPPPDSVSTRDHRRGDQVRLGGEPTSTRADDVRGANDDNKQGDHGSEGGAANAVRRSTRGSPHRGAAAAEAYGEGDREVESVTDGSAGSK